MICSHEECYEQAELRGYVPCLLCPDEELRVHESYAYCAKHAQDEPQVVAVRWLDGGKVQWL